MRAETRDGKGETARSGLKRRENGEQKKYETDRQVNEIARRPRKVERERGMERERERGRRGRGKREDISSPGAYSSIFPSSRSPSHRRTPSGAVVPLGSGPYERVTHAFLFHTRSVGLRVRTCVPCRGPFKCTCGNPCFECACPCVREFAPFHIIEARFFTDSLEPALSCAFFPQL